MSRWTGFLNILLYSFLDGFLPLFVPTCPVSKLLSSPVSLCSTCFPSSWLGKRGLIKTANGGVNFLPSHFILCIAAMPGARVDCVKEAAGFLPSLWKNAQLCDALHRDLYLLKYPAGMENKSIEHSFKKIWREDSLVGSQGISRKSFSTPLRVYYFSELEAFDQPNLSINSSPGGCPIWLRKS